MGFCFMASKNSPSRRLKKLAAEIPPDNTIHAILVGLERLENGDYALAMIGSSFIEKALEVAILSRLIPMNDAERGQLFNYENRGPLSDLSSRIRLARAMGLFGPHTFADLERIRKLRNAFAHALSYITFATRQVEDICAAFHATRRVTGDARVPGALSRAKYVHAARFIAGALKTRINAEGVAYHSPTPPADDRLP
jgi:hypothetical protein